MVYDTVLRSQGESYGPSRQSSTLPAGSLAGLSEVEKLGQHDDPLPAHLGSPEVIVSRRDHDHEGALGNDEEVLSAIAQSHEYVQGFA